MPRFTIRVSEEEFSALERSAKNDLRDFRSQARLLIRTELERRGLLDPENRNSIPEVKAHGKSQ